MNPSSITEWKDFLQTLGCKNIVEYDDWIMINCVFHEQTETIRPSLGINKDTGYCNCFGCGSHSWDDFCKKFGIESEDFISGKRSGEWEYFRKKLFKKEEQVSYKRFTGDSIGQIIDFVKTAPLALDYFLKRNFDSANLFRFLKKYRIFCCLDPSSKYRDSIIFPIYDEKGMLYFQARYCGDLSWIERWRHPKDSPLWKTYWNWENVKDSEFLVFTEGITDALKLVMYGFPAIPAKSFSDYQLKFLLHSKANTIFTFYDNDEAGIQYTEKVKNLFSDCGKAISTVKYHPNSTFKDPGEMTIMDIERTLIYNKNLSEKMKMIFQ